MNRSSLERPVRLDHRHPDFSEALDLELHVAFKVGGVSLQRFIIPGSLDTTEAIVLNSADRRSLLRIDPLLLYALWIRPNRTDTETRSAVHVFNPRGQRLLSLSSDDPQQLDRWQAYCRVYYG